MAMEMAYEKPERTGKLQATPESRLNYFRVCRITIDNIRQVLQNVFYSTQRRWHDSPADGNWFMKNERWDQKLTDEMKSKIRQGNSNNWDATILFHVLLYSSHCLFLNKVPNTQGSLKTGSNVIKATNKSADFTTYVYHGCTILFDLEYSFFRCRVAAGKSIQPNSFIISKAFKDSRISGDVINVDIYICTREWLFIEDLSRVRNDQFAHVKSCLTTHKELSVLVQKLTKIYRELAVPNHLIVEMQSMATEIISDGQVISALEKYEKVLLEERSYWFEVRHELEGIQHDLSAVKVDVQKLHEEKPQLISEIKSIQGNLIEVRKATDQNYQTVTKELERVHTQSQCIQGNVKLLEETMHTHDDKMEVVSTTLSTLRTQNTGIANRISIQGREIRDQFRDVNSQVQSQSDSIRQSHLILNALQEQQTNIAARAGYQASKIQHLEVRENEIDKNIDFLQSEVKDISQSQHDLREGVTDISGQISFLTKQLSSTMVDVEDVKHSLQTDEIEGELKILEPSFFDAEVNYYSNKCHQKTRLWLINGVTDWVVQSLSNNSRLYLITANAGMGKSVIAGKLCHKFAELGILAGCFFFQHNKIRRSNPISVIHTLAYSLCCSVPSFRSEFIQRMSTLNSKKLSLCSAAELFTLLILEPLGKLTVSNIKVFVIDGLDECEHKHQPEMIKLILREFTKLPNWISIVITSRADETIRKLKHVRPKVHVNPDDQQNLNDIKSYLQSILVGRIDPSSFQDAIDLLVKKSEGLFLYFHYSVQVLIERQELTIALLEELLPEGIDDYFNQNFHRLHVQVKQFYHPLLSTIVAARSGLPAEIISEILNCSSQVSGEIIHALSAIFPITNGVIQLFHSSIRDWITNPMEAEEDAVSMEIGHKLLVDYMKGKLNFLMDSCPHENEIQSNRLTRFITRNIIYHESAIKEYSMEVCQWLTDLQFLYYHIVVSHGVTGLLQDFNRAKTILHLVPSALRRSVESSEIFIRKHMEILEKPLLLFQLALNDGSTFQHNLSMVKLKNDPKKIFHELKCILTQKDPRSSPGLIAEILQPLPVTSCRVLKNEIIVTTCSNSLGKGLLCLWEWKDNAQPILEINVGGGVNCCDISLDEKLIACGGISRIYDTNGEKVDILGSSFQNIQYHDCSLFSPNMDTLLCWESREIKLPNFIYHLELWDLQNSSKVVLDQTKDLTERVLCASYSPDGSIAISGHANGSIKVWHCQNMKIVYKFSLPDLYPEECNIQLHNRTGVEYNDFNLSDSGLSFNMTVDPSNLTADSFNLTADSINLTANSFNLTADSINLTANSFNLTADSFNLTNDSSPSANKIHPVSKRYTNMISSCLFTLNGRFIIASRDLKLYVFDAKTYQLIETDEITVHKKYRDDYITSICSSVDSSYVVASTDYGTVWWWKYVPAASSSSCKHYLFDGYIQEQGLGLCCTLDKDYHLLIGNMSNLRIFDFNILVSEQQQLHDYRHGTYVSCSAVLQNKFLTSGDGKLHLWSSEETKILNTVEDVQNGDFICLSPREDFIAVYGSTSTVELRDAVSLQSFKCLIPEVEAVSTCYCCCISTTNLVACGYESGHVCIFYGPSMDNSLFLEGHEGEIRWLSFSPDGLALVSGDDTGVLFMWHFSIGDSGRSVCCTAMNPMEPHKDCIKEICYSAVKSKMSRVVSCSFDSNIHLYHGSTGELIQKIIAIDPFCLRYSPNGETFVVGSCKGRINIYDGFTGGHLVTLFSTMDKLHPVEVSCIAFTEICSCQYLVTGSYDYTVRVWNPVTGDCLTVMPLSQYVMFLEVCDSYTIIAGTYDGQVYVISLHTY